MKERMKERMKQTFKRTISMVMMILIIVSSIPAFAGETQLLQVSGFDPNILYQEGSDVIIIRTTSLKTAAQTYVNQVFGTLSTDEYTRIVNEVIAYFSPNTGMEIQSNNDGNMITTMYKENTGDYIVFTRESSGFSNPSSNGSSSSTYVDFLKQYPEVESITVMGMVIYDKRQPDEMNEQGLSLIEPALQDPTFAPDGTVVFNNKPAETHPINRDFFDPEKSPLGNPTGSNATPTENTNTTPESITTPESNTESNNTQTPVQTPVLKPVVVVEPVDGVIDNIPSLKPGQDVEISVVTDETIKITEPVIDSLKDNDSDIIIKTESGNTKEIDTDLIDKEVIIISVPETDSLYPEDIYIDLSNRTDDDLNPVANVQDNDVVLVIEDRKDDVVIGTPEAIIEIPERTNDEVILITKDEDKRTDNDKIDPITIVVIDEERATAEVSFVDTKDDDYIVVASEDDKMVYVPSNKNNPEGLIKAKVESGDTVSLRDKVGGSHITDPVIKDLYIRGIIQGYPDGTFGENKTITRAEASAIIYNSLSNTDRIKKNTSKFNDVNGGSWFAKYVNGNDAFKGYPDGSFKPENNITKEEMYALTARLTKLTDNSKSNIFTSSDWSKPHINKILNLGFISEVKDVKTSITRGEVFELIHKIVTQDLEKQIF